MRKRRESPSRETQFKILNELFNTEAKRKGYEDFCEKIFSMDDDGVDAMLDGSGWKCYRILDDGEIISRKEYLEMFHQTTC